MVRGGSRSPRRRKEGVCHRCWEYARTGGNLDREPALLHSTLGRRLTSAAAPKTAQRREKTCCGLGEARGALRDAVSGGPVNGVCIVVPQSEGWIPDNELTSKRAGGSEIREVRSNRRHSVDGLTARAPRAWCGAQE